MFRNSALIVSKSNDTQVMSYTSSKQSGSALVIAIFIIVVLSVLGAALVNMLDSSQEGLAYEVLGTRAYAAAQSGLQWQLSEVFPLSSDALACKAQASIDAATPNFSQTQGLAQCRVSVSCSDFVHDNIRYYNITSTGECVLDGEVTARTLAVEARSL
ncbi:MSHA biogenesis protein MshP [Colwellia chukchiensis]|uniref:MSHA biogenesis protein MshP n=1 Tax=Colwellia chukchiensis TaxID=641665 RepID=A0A1H7L9N4_9GAMM|nr:pilus assembly PilX N-terminal domain-containing protein [Colwellia chukchiensis]SEK95692.1 MSHA biogenesis protein MshP [Colwellia chukchiensis]